MMRDRGGSSPAWDIYDLLIEKVAGRQATMPGTLSETKPAMIDSLLIGLTWTLCRIETGAGDAGLAEYHPAYNIGLAMSPGMPTRTLPWPGSLAGRPVIDVADWLRSWDPYEATVGMATVNAVLNADAPLLERAEVITLPDRHSEPGAASGGRSGLAPAMLPGNLPPGNLAPGNLAVFEHFLPRLHGQRVVVVGRYPGLERYADVLDLHVLERQPGGNDLPDPACEYLLPQADWVFLTASSLTNKTFPRLAELASDANLVLMGPTVPWLAEFADYGVDFLAGVRVADPARLYRTVAEGGGTRIFDAAVQYCVVDLGVGEMHWIKSAIADMVAHRERLKRDMEAWYARTRRAPFPGTGELVNVDRELSLLDSQFKRLWDARHPRRESGANALSVSHFVA